MNKDVAFPPLLNGLDYLQDALDRLRGTPTPRDLKYAVLHLAAGAEVLLKYRLICQDRKLVIDNVAPDRVSDRDFELGNFKSIGLDAAMERLDTELGIKLTSDEKHAIKALRRFRNALQHLGMTITVDAVTARTVQVLGFLLAFIDEHLAPQVQPTVQDEQLIIAVMDEIRQGLHRMDLWVEHAYRARSAPYAPSSPCPACGLLSVLLEGKGFQPTSIRPHQQPRCTFCARGWASRGQYVDELTESLGLSWYGAVKDGGEEPTDSCPECGAHQVVWFSPTTGRRAHRRDMIGRCFSCENEFDDRCPRCNRPVSNSDPEGPGVCGDCLDDLD